jgi:predicted enzyme related to lactoylglutathione lyase
MTSEQPRTYPAGVTSWIDVEQPDLDAAAEFYHGLFGWEVTDVTAPGAEQRYLVATLDGRDVAGLAGPADGPAGWNTYVAVDDVAAAVARVEAAGGRILAPPSDVGEAGRSATCADPEGIPFRLWQAGRRPGAQVTNAPGAWNFSDLYAVDPTTATKFYAEVLGWAFDDLGFATMIRRPGYGAHLAATVDPGILERQAGGGAPPGFEDAIGWLNQAGADQQGPRWHVTFTVADRDETAALAERLGGLVLDQGDTDWTHDALLRDPQGAVFTASQFDPQGG